MKKYTEEEKKEFLKRLKRFLKEKGRYKFIMAYLFTKGRSVEDFFNDMHSNNINIKPLPRGNLGGLFYNAEILGKSYKLTGYDYWYANIRQTAEEWRHYIEDGSEDELPF